MTRVRVLMAARKLLAAGYLPIRKHVSATDAVGVAVSYMHPSAVNFNFATAIQRAVLNLTEDDYINRTNLYDAAIDPLVERLGGVHAAREFFTTATQEEAIKVFDEQLEEWNNA